MKNIHKIIILLSIIILSITIAIVIIFNMANILALKEVHIIGNKNLSSEFIFKLSDLSYNTPIYRINLEKIKNKMENNPFIEYVEVSMMFPNTISINITERKPIALLTMDKQSYLIDKNGVILEKTKKPYVKNDFLRIQFLEKLDNVDYYEGETIAIPELSRLIKDILEIDRLYSIKKLINKIQLSLVKRNIYIKFDGVDTRFDFINGINAENIKKAKTIYLELKNKKNNKISKIVISENLVIIKN